MHFSDEAPDSKTGLIMGVEKSMLLFSETEESSGIKPIVNRLLSGRGNAEKRDRFSALPVIGATGTLSVK